MSRCYRLPDGREAFVSIGLPSASDGVIYMTVTRKPGAIGTHRVKSMRLPLRKNRTHAQTDLDAYAASKGWEAIAGE